MMNQTAWLGSSFTVVSGAVAAIALSSSPVQAASFTVDGINGIWSDVTGTSVFSGVGTNEVRWGTPASGTENSGLRFDNAAGPLTIASGSNFVLGALTHLNFPILGGTGASGVNLDLSLLIDGVLQSFDYQFAINETPNTNLSSCPSFQISSVPCDDKIDFTSPFSSTTFAKDGTNYTLELLGFSGTPDGLSPLSSFVTEESQESSAFLVARVVTDPTPVPEPAMGLGIALLGLGAANLRRKPGEEAVG